MRKCCVLSFREGWLTHQLFRHEPPVRSFLDPSNELLSIIDMSACLMVSSPWCSDVAVLFNICSLYLENQVILSISQWNSYSCVTTAVYIMPQANGWPWSTTTRWHNTILSSLLPETSTKLWRKHFQTTTSMSSAASQDQTHLTPATPQIQMPIVHPLPTLKENQITSLCAFFINVGSDWRV